MLILKLEGEEFWDEIKNEFVYSDPTEVKMEHSLVSIYKWESKYHVPFLGREHEKTPEEFVEYIRFMILSKNADNDTIRRIITSKEHMETIKKYMDDTMTATKFSKRQQAQAKINQGGGIFFNRNTDQQNIIAMRRLSFIIYSCPKDMYSSKLKQIMEKAKEIITKY